MDQKINKVCGIDVHKLFVFAAIMISGVEEPIIKRVSTDRNGLLELRNWLTENDVERVAMESTGIYWRIVYWALQDCFEMILANAKEIHDLRQVRRKTDKGDCIWIASIHDPPVHPMSMKIPKPTFAAITHGRPQCPPICMSIFGASLATVASRLPLTIQVPY